MNGFKEEFTRKLQRAFSFCCIIVVSSLLLGCGKVVLYSDLKEREINEMMAILIDAGVACEKKEGSEDDLWSLSVVNAGFSIAVDVLKKNGYPKEHFVGMGDVFQKSGLVSSPTEERIRFMYALSQEVSETISQIDGVLSARVHIVLPENDVLEKNMLPASASVFIKHRAETDLESLVPKIKSLVVNSIEGLTYDKVSVGLFPAEEALIGLSTQRGQQFVRVLFMNVAPESATMVKVVIGLVFVLLLVVLGGGGYYVWRMKQGEE